MDFPTPCAIFLLLAVKSYECANNLQQFKRRPDLDGFTCSESQRVFSHTFTSDGTMGCMAKCARYTNCLSAFYHSDTRQCDGCIGMYHESFDTTEGFLEAVSGTLSYEKRVCPNGWIQWSQSCYKLTDVSSTFEDGATECESAEGHVVHIGNDIENRYIYQQLSFHGISDTKYIGYTYNPSTSQWQYYASNEVPVYTNFYDNEGDNKLSIDDNQYCSVFYIYTPEKWHDYVCLSVSRTLCEIDV